MSDYDPYHYRIRKQHNQHKPLWWQLWQYRGQCVWELIGRLWLRRRYVPWLAFVQLDGLLCVEVFHGVTLACMLPFRALEQTRLNIPVAFDSFRRLFLVFQAVWLSVAYGLIIIALPAFTFAAFYRNCFFLFNRLG